MRLFIVSIRDEALGAFMRPAYVPSVGVAIRGFTDECNKAESEIRKHPEDYCLFYFGSFDDETGEFEIKSTPERLIAASQCMVLTQ